MKPVEQAIFTSSGGDCAGGCQIAAQSPGLCAEDARELAVWGPSGDALPKTDAEGVSYHFHPLPSGNYCISRTAPADWDSGERGRNVFTRCLIVPPEVLARHGNNPFALIRSAVERGVWGSALAACPALESLRFLGGAAAVDEALLGQLAVDIEPARMAALLQAARQSLCLAISGAGRPVEWIAGLFSCLPPECRLEYSFTTGMKFSLRRPFRIVALSGDPAERQWVENSANVAVMDLCRDGPSKSTPIDGWSRLIERVLATGQIPFLAVQLSKRRFNLAPNDLPALGLQLMEELEALEFHRIFGPGRHFTQKTAPRGASTPQSPLGPCPRAHAAHPRFEKSGGLRAAMSAGAGLDPDSPAMLESLEMLDDLVYEAIGGNADAIEDLQERWPKILEQVGEDSLLESREQYLRYALSVWQDCIDADGVRNVNRAMPALDVLCLLFGAGF